MEVVDLVPFYYFLEYTEVVSIINNETIYDIWRRQLNIEKSTSINFNK